MTLKKYMSTSAGRYFGNTVMIYQADRKVKPQIKKSEKKIQPSIFEKKEICFIENVKIDIKFHFYERFFPKIENPGLYFFFRSPQNFDFSGNG